MENRWNGEYNAFFSSVVPVPQNSISHSVSRNRPNCLDPYLPVRSPAQSGGEASAMHAMLRRTKCGKVSKSNTGSARRDSTLLSFSCLTDQQFEPYPSADPNIGSNEEHIDPASPPEGGDFGTNVHMNEGGAYPNSHSPMTRLHPGVQHQFAEGGFQLHGADKAELPSSPPVTHSTPLGESSSSPIKRAADVAFASYGDSVKIDSALCKKLADEPAKREPTQRRHDQKLNIERRSNVEALLAHVTGELAARPCKNCHKGHGPWTQCVVYEGQMCGSCTNCWFNASGSRCTFHENNNPQPIAQATAASTPTQSQAVVAYQPTPSATASVAAITFADDLLQMGLREDTGRMITGAISEVKHISKQQRLITRIEAAAKELGMRIAEYDEYMRSPEGRQDQEEEHEQLRRLQRHGASVDPSSPSSSLP